MNFRFLKITDYIYNLNIFSVYSFVERATINITTGPRLHMQNFWNACMPVIVTII